MKLLILIVVAFALVAWAQGDSCSDYMRNCGKHKKMKLCQNNVGVQVFCKKTCGLCGPPTLPPTQGDSCKDNSRNCDKYKNYCKNNQVIQMHCKKTCGLCGPPQPTLPPTQPPPTPPPGTLPPNMDQCGKRMTRNSRVIGGDDAKRGDWPWQVLMLKNNRGSCGGTLIAPQWVVSAAHCVYRDVKHPEIFKIRVGEHDRTTTEQGTMEYEVERVISHPDWNSRTLDYDIALFKLKKPVIYGEFVQPACLPSGDLPVGTKCFITGWGKIKHPGGMHHYLQQAELPIVNSTVCEAKNRKFIPIPITSRMICGGEGGINPKSGCHGDSGGPYVCKVGDNWELHGDVSHGSPRCKSSETYTVFARTYFFKPWILKQMKKYAN